MAFYGTLLIPAIRTGLYVRVGTDGGNIAGTPAYSA